MLDCVDDAWLLTPTTMSEGCQKYYRRIYVLVKPSIMCLTHVVFFSSRTFFHWCGGVANMQGDNFQNAWSLKTWGDSFFALLKRNDEKLSKVIQVLQRKIAICQLYEFGNPNLWKLLILRKISVVRANVTHYLNSPIFVPKLDFDNTHS